jgi:hypothetical protein
MHDPGDVLGLAAALPQGVLESVQREVGPRSDVDARQPTILRLNRSTTNAT